MSTMNLAILAIKIFSFAILISQVSSADFSALLSRLYKRASASDRPLIVLIDSNLLSSEPQTHKKPNTLLNVIGYNRQETRGAPLSLVQKKEKLQPKIPYKLHKSYDIEKKLHQTLLPKRLIPREKEVLRSPIIKNLLRISNNLRCQARNECEDKCNNRYSGHKNYKCVNNCETKFVCEEEPESGCDECEANSCGDNNCVGSTKGYTSTEPSVGCPEC